MWLRIYWFIHFRQPLCKCHWYLRVYPIVQQRQHRWWYRVLRVCNGRAKCWMLRGFFLHIATSDRSAYERHECRKASVSQLPSGDRRPEQLFVQHIFWSKSRYVHSKHIILLLLYFAPNFPNILIHVVSRIIFSGLVKRRNILDQLFHDANFGRLFYNVEFACYKLFQLLFFRN